MLSGKRCRAKERCYLLYPRAYPPSPSPTSTILPGAPPSQHCCIYYDKSFSNLFGYRELLISRICLFSLGWNDQDAK